MSSQDADLIDRSVVSIENLMTAMPMRKVSKVLKVDKWHPASQTFLYFFLVGAILFVLNIFNLMPWGVLWIYSLFIIIMWGFMFKRPDERYKITLVLGFFLILAFIPSRAGQMLLDVNWSEDDPLQFSGMYASLKSLSQNPYDVRGIMDVINWIVFLAFIGYGASTVGDALTFQWGKIAQKGAIIAMAIAVMSLMYGIFGSAGLQVRTIWDTIGSAWTDFLKNVGLAQLDAQGNTLITHGTVVNGIFSLIPLIIIISCLSFAIYFRKKAFHSILFARSILEEETIEVRRVEGFSTPVLIILISMIIYIVGYNLMTADPVLIVDPIITLTFYISSGIILLLIGLKVIILNKDRGPASFIKSFLKWTVFGLMGLFLYFQAFQPALYELGIISEKSALLSIGENSALLGNDMLNQLFIVAMPETLIFQVAITGIGNRIYFRLRKGTLIKREEKRLTKKRETLMNRLEVIPINESTSKANLKNIAKRAVIRKKVEEIDRKLDESQVSKLPFSYFILPSLIFSLFSAFLFSDYHRFRRGMTFQGWWQNYMFGLTYMGAGFFLNLVALFNWLAAIIVHWLNNMIAMVVSA